MAITYDDNSIHVYRGQPSRKKVIYSQSGSKLRLSCLWDRFLPAAATITSVWATSPASDSRVAFSSSAVSGQGVETYATFDDNIDQYELVIKNTVTASTGEIASAFWRIYVTDDA